MNFDILTPNLNNSGWKEELVYEHVAEMVNKKEETLHLIVQQLFSKNAAHFEVTITDSNGHSRNGTLELTASYLLLHVVFVEPLRFALPPKTRITFSVLHPHVVRLTVPSAEGTLGGTIELSFPTVWDSLLFSYLVRMYTWYCDQESPESIPINGSILNKQLEINCLVSRCVSKGQAKFKMYQMDKKENQIPTLLTLDANEIVLIIEHKFEPLIYEYHQIELQPTLGNSNSKELHLHLTNYNQKQTLKFFSNSENEIQIFLKCLQVFSTIHQNLQSSKDQKKIRTNEKNLNQNKKRNKTGNNEKNQINIVIGELNEQKNKKAKNGIQIEDKQITSIKNNKIKRISSTLFLFPDQNKNNNGGDQNINKNEPRNQNKKNLLKEQPNLTLQRTRSHTFQTETGIRKNIMIAMFDFSGTPVLINRQWPMIPIENQFIQKKEFEKKKKLALLVGKFYQQKNASFQLSVINTNMWNSKDQNPEIIFQLKTKQFQILSDQLLYSHNYSNEIIIVIHPLIENLFMIRTLDDDKYTIFWANEGHHRDIVCNCFIIFKLNSFSQKRINLNSLISIHSFNEKESNTKMDFTNKEKKKRRKNKNKKIELISTDDENENKKENENEHEHENENENENGDKDWKKYDFEDFSQNNEFVFESQFLYDKSSGLFSQSSFNEKFNILKKTKTPKSYSIYPLTNSNYSLSLFNSFGAPSGYIQIQLFTDHFSINVNNLKIERQYSIYSKLFFLNSTTLVAKFNLDEFNMIYIGFNGFEQRIGFTLDFERKKNIQMQQFQLPLSLDPTINNCKICLKTKKEVDAKIILDKDFFSILTENETYSSEYHYWINCYPVINDEDEDEDEDYNNKKKKKGKERE
ncbi:32 kda heat shock protein [Anaeramoeba flamelloides]|uniref:32 kDa heat shock protein n=1 Tax=Anaeramoeba flamelloides TaxID=1746091 RepID=A0ABQ8XNA1_9EUKA|nr:32 kda heat shock protein [Anaeramoeba flamelloides]